MQQSIRMFFATIVATVAIQATLPQAEAGDGLICGGLPSYRLEWSPWYHVDIDKGVEAEVRYMFKHPGAKKPITVMQMRYINHSHTGRVAHISNVKLNFVDGSVAVWAGESVEVAARSVALGKPQYLKGQLCTWTKSYWAE